jgi:cob(I)alamin adenosyltransferase
MTTDDTTSPEAKPAKQRVPSVVLVNTGDGKGKSSAAFGVMGRAWARGWKVGVVQFIKSGDWNTGEHKLALHLGIEWFSLGDGFTWDSTDLDETAAKAKHAWGVAKEMLASGEYNLLIFDELTYSITFNWINEAEIISAITHRAPKTNVIVTGRGATQGLLDIAHTATEMNVIKHAYDQGINAMKGIEY